jgi:hypothetical protein
MRTPPRAAWPTANDPPIEWDAHSTALDIAATRGLPALLAFAALFAVALRGAFQRAVTPTGLALLAALSATAFDALTIDIEDMRHVWLLCGLVLCDQRLNGTVTHDSIGVPSARFGQTRAKPGITSTST